MAVHPSACMFCLQTQSDIKEIWICVSALNVGPTSHETETKHITVLGSISYRLVRKKV
jgi:hypothetical protein